MTPRPSDLPARLLPVRVRPFPQETVGSYTRRLASANHLPFAEFLDHLADNQAAQRPTLIRSHELRLNQPAISRLAAYSGMPAAALRRHCPA